MSRRAKNVAVDSIIVLLAIIVIATGYLVEQAFNPKRAEEEAASAMVDREAGVTTHESAGAKPAATQAIVSNSRHVASDHASDIPIR